MTKNGVAILGIFVADLAFRASRMPGIGETISGSGFKMGPGGKGSNQAVAAARAGADVTFISRLGRDDFGAVALATWQAEGITAAVKQVDDAPTGAAFIYVNDRTGENAIIVVPGAAAGISAADIDEQADAIRNAAVFVTQLEQPVAAARRGLEIAREAGVITIFNPAPAEPVDDDIYPLCDYVTPNESEAALLTGVPVNSLEDARRAAEVFLAKGARNALITLGENGALLHSRAGLDPYPGVPRRQRGRDRRGRRCVQWRLCRRARPRRYPRGRRPLRQRRRRHFRDPPGYGAVDADAGRGRGAAGAGTRAAPPPPPRCAWLCLPRRRGRSLTAAPVAGILPCAAGEGDRRMAVEGAGLEPTSNSPTLAPLRAFGPSSATLPTRGRERRGCARPQRTPSPLWGGMGWGWPGEQPVPFPPISARS